MFDNKNNLGHRERIFFMASFSSKICKNSKTLTGAGTPAGQKFSTDTRPVLAGRLPLPVPSLPIMTGLPTTSQSIGTGSISGSSILCLIYKDSLIQSKLKLSCQSRYKKMKSVREKKIAIVLRCPDSRIFLKLHMSSGSSTQPI